MNVVPAGIVSLKTTFVAGIVPSLVNVIVYVITSPISTAVLSTVLTGFVIAVLTGVVVGGVGFVVVIGGFVGSGSYVNVVVPIFRIKPFSGREVT
ncbi:hypothetical protein protein [Bacillus cereus G9241]|nr:hypothetical protein protein [Bacillus cereus G9241]